MSRLRPSLKTLCYANLAVHNPWLLTCNEKVRNYLRYQLTPRRESMNTRRAGPVFMTINLTRRCNLSCRFCIVGDVLNKRQWRDQEATTARVDALLRHPVARRCLYVMLTGGEPLLNDDLLPIVRLIKSRRHLLSINTNALHLSEVLDDLHRSGLDMLNVSHYDENHEVLASILERANHKIFTKLLKIIGKAHVEEPAMIERVLRLARSSGCRRVFFQNVYPHVDGLAKRSVAPSQLIRSGSEAAPIDERDESEYRRIRADLSSRYSDVSVFWPAPVRTSIAIGSKTCRMPWYLFAVDAAGNMGFCSAHASCTGPNIFDIPRDQVMNQQRWRQTRRALLSRDDRIPESCRGCYTLQDSWRRDM